MVSRPTCELETSETHLLRLPANLGGCHHNLMLIFPHEENLEFFAF